MFEAIRRFLKGLTGEQAEEAVRKLHKPTNMSRRGFLRALGVGTTTVLLGDLSKLVVEPAGRYPAYISKSWSVMFVVGKEAIFHDCTPMLLRHAQILGEKMVEDRQIRLLSDGKIVEVQPIQYAGVVTMDEKEEMIHAAKQDQPICCDNYVAGM